MFQLQMLCKALRAIPWQIWEIDLNGRFFTFSLHGKSENMGVLCGSIFRLRYEATMSIVTSSYNVLHYSLSVMTNMH